MPRSNVRRRKPGRVGRFASATETHRLGRVRGRAAGVHRQLHLSDIAQRLSPYRRLGDRAELVRCPRHPDDRRAGRGAQPGRASGSCTPIQASRSHSGTCWARGSMRQSCRCLTTARRMPKTPMPRGHLATRPAETLEKAREIQGARLPAAKFGLGPLRQGQRGRGCRPAPCRSRRTWFRCRLLVDAGTIWVEDVERAAKALPALAEVRAEWFESPLSGASKPIQTLASWSGPVRLAGGEGAHNGYMARDMIDRAGISYVQIDSGRIGGIWPSRLVAVYARDRRQIRQPHLHLLSRACRVAAPVCRHARERTSASIRLTPSQLPGRSPPPPSSSSRRWPDPAARGAREWAWMSTLLLWVRPFRTSRSGSAAARFIARRAIA